MHLLSQVGTFQGQKSVQRSLHLGFELYRDWLCCVSLTTQFLFFTSSLTLCPIFLSPLYSHRLSPCLTFVCSLFSISLPPTTTFFFCFLPVALYAISAVYFAGVMVRLMLTLTPVVCMLSAVAFSSVFEHYMGDDTKREKPPAEDSSDEDDKRNSGNLYDKVKTGEKKMFFMIIWFLKSSWKVCVISHLVQEFIFITCMFTHLFFCELPFEAVPLISAVPLCWMLIWLLSPLSQTVSLSISVHLVITSFHALPTTIHPEMTF